jgi:predicted transposase/invertase (TIGR01784 family)
VKGLRVSGEIAGHARNDDNRRQAAAQPADGNTSASCARSTGLLRGTSNTRAHGRTIRWEKNVSLRPKLPKKMEEKVVEVVERLDPLNDFLFQKMMGEKGDEEQLLGFLNAVLKRTNKDNLQSVEIVDNKKMTAEVIGDKSSILDVRATTNDGTHVNIEVQLRHVSSMERRVLYYWSRDFAKAIDRGQDYKMLPNIIAICIVDEELFPHDKAFHTSFHLREDVDKDFVMTDAIELHFIDMVKFRRVENKDIEHNALHRWTTFFDRRTEVETINKIISMDTAIRKANERILVVASDKETLRAYHMREMAMSDYTSGMNSARREGEQIGEQRGEQRGELKALAKMLQNMKAAGASMEIMQVYTGLSIDEIKQLQVPHGTTLY